MSDIPLFEVPVSWAWATLGQCFDIVGGATPKSDDKSCFDEVGVPWVTPADFSKLNGKYVERGSRSLTRKGFDSCSTRLLPKGSVLFSTRAPIGHIAIAKNEICTNQGFKSLPFVEQINSEFLYFFLKHITPFIQSLGSGTTFKEVSGTVMKTVPLILPPPKEQQRIVTKIESCFSKIDATERSLDEAEALLKKYRESLLAKAFRGELVPQDPKDEPASELLKHIRAERAAQDSGKKSSKDKLPPIAEEDIPFEIPKTWEWVRLGDISSRITDGVHQKPNYTTEGVPFISVKDITTGTLHFSDCKFVSKKDHEKFTMRCKAERGDILYTKVGATYGRPALVDTDKEFSIYVSVALIKPERACLDSTYLYYLMNNWTIKHQADQRISGIGVPDLHLVEIREFLIPLPPLEEQRRIACRLIGLADSLKRPLLEVESAKSLVARMRASVLSAAFSGRLVQQIPEEGTGHALLGQILKSKAPEMAEPGTKSPRKPKGGLKGKKK